MKDEEVKPKLFNDNKSDQLTGTPSVRPEYYIRERRVVRAEITVERVVNLVGLGATGLIGSGAMITDIVS